MQRILMTIALATLAVVLVAGTAWAGPDTGSAKPLLTKTAKPTTLFGYAGKRPLDSNTPSGIARPEPAPRIETAAFGAATQCLPAKPAIVRPRTCPPRVYGSSSDGARVVVRECADGSCSPCGTYCPTTRINDEPLSVSPHYWSSGYHDGAQVKNVSPCQPVCSQPVYRSPCEPCEPEPCYEPCDPCTPRVVVRRPVRVVRRVCAPVCGPRYSPCWSPCRSWCGPRVRVGFAPYWGWGWGGGFGWGGCW